MLNTFFNLLKEAVTGVEDKIEILVSNNRSTDNTSLICREWGAVFLTKTKFRYFEQEKNIGVAKNITFLLGESVGSYFVVIGDDDRFSSENFLRIMEILQSSRNPSAVIQGEWGVQIGLSQSGYRSFLDAAQLFYEYGNAYTAIIDRRAAQEAILDDAFRAQVLEIVWPQTVFGFLAIHSRKDRPIFITDFIIGMPAVECQNITNKAYWVSSLHGLLRASYLIDGVVGFDWTKKAFARWGTPGFRNHITSILRLGLIYENSTSVKLIHELKSHFGLRGRFWALILAFSDNYPRLLYWLVIIASSVLHFESPFVAKGKIEKARERYLADVNSAKFDHKRSEGFF